MNGGVAFRVDASLQIGTGHVMRCLTLADALQTQGVKSTFICRLHEGHLIQKIKQRGHETIELPAAQHYYPDKEKKLAHADWLGAHWIQDAEQISNALQMKKFDWLVVDHYALDIQWEQELRTHYTKLMVIDDLADREHCCDLLLDQNLGRSPKDYENLIPPNAMTLVGPRYALLRPEFAQWRSYSLNRRSHGKLQNLLITMGGVDKDNVTEQVLTALAESDLPHSLKITVVMGAHAPWIKQVKKQASKMMQTTTVLADVNNMAELMADSDWAIGAAGSTSWERCCVGLPTIQIALAINQVSIAQALNEKKAAIAIELNDVVEKLTFLMNDPVLEEKMSEISTVASKVTSGEGADDVVRSMKGLL